MAIIEKNITGQQWKKHCAEVSDANSYQLPFVQVEYKRMFLNLAPYKNNIQ